VQETLKVQIRQAAETREFLPRTVFGQAGYYVADIVPTRVGHYQWTFVGRIGDDQMKEKFDSADGKSDSIEPIAELQFLVALGVSLATASSTNQVRSVVDSVRTLALAAVGDGVLGLLALSPSGQRDHAPRPGSRSALRTRACA